MRLSVELLIWVVAAIVLQHVAATQDRAETTQFPSGLPVPFMNLGPIRLVSTAPANDEG